MGSRCPHRRLKVRVWMTGWDEYSVEIGRARLMDEAEAIPDSAWVTCLDCGALRQTDKGPWPKWAEEALCEAAGGI